MRKSSNAKRHYRPGTSRGGTYLATFREQMTDFARGDRLLELRAGTGQSRESVAHAIGVTTKSLYTWEKKSGAIKAAHAKQLAMYYGIEDWQSLVTRDPHATTGPSSRGQVGEGFEEFRGHVHDLEERLDRIEQAISRIGVENQRQLAQQDEVLGKILAIVRALGLDDRLAEARETMALDTVPERAPQSKS